MEDSLAPTSFALNHLVFHLSQCGLREPLIALFDRQDFLAKKADSLQTLALTSDIEDFLLPALLEKRDWPRYLQFAAVAANLRSLGDEADIGEMLEIIAVAPTPKLATELCRSVSQPVARAAIRAALSLRYPDEREFALSRIQDDLAHIQPPTGDREVRSLGDALLVAAGFEGALQWPRWPEWLEWLGGSPCLIDVQVALFKNLIDAGAPENPLWRELRSRMVDPGRFAATAAEKLIGLPTDQIGSVWQGLTRLLASPRWRRRAWFPLLSAAAEKKPRRALGAFKRMLADDPDFYWTYDSAQWGAGFLLHCETDDAPLTPAAQAVLAVIRLEHEPTLARVAIARTALANAPKGPGRRRWFLRFLLVCLVHRHPVDAVARRIVLQPESTFQLTSEELRTLWECRMHLDAGDAALWLARDFASCQEVNTLIEAVGMLDHQALLDIIWDHAEALVSYAEPESERRLELHARLIERITTAKRLLSPERSLTFVAASRQKLRPDRFDQMCRRTSVALAGEDATLAGQIAGAIHDRCLRTLVKLYIQTRASSLAATPAELFEAFADIAFLMDEWRLLMALTPEAVDSETLVTQCLASVGDGPFRSRAQFFLSRHRLQRETRDPKTSDRWGALSFLNPGMAHLGAGESQLEALIWAVQLGEAARPERAHHEYEMAFNFLFVPEGVGEKELSNAFADLIAGLKRHIQSADGDNGHARKERRWFQVAKTVAALPNSSLRDRYGDRQKKTRRAWPDLFPWLLTLNEAWSPPYRERFQKWMVRQIAGYRAWWPADKGVWLDWALAPPSELASPSGAVHKEDQTMLALILAVRGLGSPSAYLAQLEDCPAREALGLQLLRHGVWKPACEAAQGCMTSMAAKAEAAIHLGDMKDLSIEDIAQVWRFRPLAMGISAFDRLLEKAWSVSPETALPPLAYLIQQSLRQSPSAEAKALLVLFLHVLMAPKMGRATRLPKGNALFLRISRARVLSSSQAARANPLASSEDPERERGSSRNTVAAAWQKGSLQAFVQSWGQRFHPFLAAWWAGCLGMVVLFIDSALFAAEASAESQRAPTFLDGSLTNWIVGVLIGTGLTSAVIVEGYFARYGTRRETRWWLVARPLLSMTPLCWPLGMILHFHLKPKPLTREQAISPFLARVAAFADTPMRFLRMIGLRFFKAWGSREPLILLFLLWTPLLTFFLTLWFSAVFPLRGPSPGLLLAAVVGHGAMFGALRLFLRNATVRLTDPLPQRLLISVSWLCLVPVVFIPQSTFLWIGLLKFKTESLLREKTLVYRLFGNYSLRNIAWQGHSGRSAPSLRNRLFGKKNYPARPILSPGRRDRALLTLIDIKLASLILEAAIISAVWIFAASPDIDHHSVVIALSVVITALLTLSTAFAFSRSPVDPGQDLNLPTLHPKAVWLPFLYAFLAFIVSYGALTRENAFLFWAMAISFSFFFLNMVSFFLKGVDFILNFRFKWEMAYPLVPFFVLLLGWSFLKDAPNSLAGIAFWGCIYLSAVPVWGFFLWRIQGPVLCKPFRLNAWRDPQAHAAARLSSALQALVTILPLGGLLLPFWLWTRLYLRGGAKREAVSPQRDSGPGNGAAETP